MRIRFETTEELSAGLDYLLPDLGVERTTNGEFTIVAYKSQEDMLKITRKGNEISIFYKEKVCFFLKKPL